eukprot:11583817-Alexandrium_andersonii.AAC.1
MEVQPRAATERVADFRRLPPTPSAGTRTILAPAGLLGAAASPSRSSSSTTFANLASLHGGRSFLPDM